MSEDVLPKKLNLVILDDDRDILRLISHVINKSRGDVFNVYSFSDSAAAQRWIKNSPCEILVSDIDMPNLNGLELLQSLKVTNPWMQIILITGHSTWTRLSEAIQKGANDYLVKPIESNQLLTVIDQARSRFIRWQAAVGATFASLDSSGAGSLLPLDALDAAPLEDSAAV